jgi:hypothetical protein
MRFGNKINQNKITLPTKTQLLSKIKRLPEIEINANQHC